MDMEDLDSWYDEKKALLEEKYLANVRKINKKKKFQIFEEIKVDTKIDLDKKILFKKNKLKEKYQNDMKNLHIKYDKKAKRILESNLKKHFLKHRINMLKKTFLDWKPVRNYLIKHYKVKKDNNN